MFNLGFSEMILIAVIALLVIGPKQLPEVARALGRMINEFKRATGDLSKSMINTEKSMGDMMNQTQEQIKKDVGIKQVQESLSSIQRDVEEKKTAKSEES